MPTGVIYRPAPLADFALAQRSRPAILGPRDSEVSVDELAADVLQLRQAAYRASIGETLAAMLSTALGQVGYLSPSYANQESKYNTWFAGIHGSSFRNCAWCAIFMCWVGASGAIPPSRQSAGALALVDEFPRTSMRAGALVGYSGRYFPEGHTELIIKTDPSNPDYFYAVGGNTTGGGQGAIGVKYTHRYAPGNVVAYSWPDYAALPAPAPKPPAPGKLAVDGVFGPLTVDAMDKVEKIPVNGIWDTTSAGLVCIKATQKRIDTPVDGKFGVNSVEALQHHVGAPVDGSWGPTTTEHLQTALNANTF